MPKLELKTISYILFQVWEVLAFFIAIAAGFYALERQGMAIASDYATPGNAAIFAALAFVWNRLLKGFDLYQSRRLIRRGSEFGMVIGAVVAGAAVLALFGAFLNIPMNQAPFLTWFIIVAGVALVAGRLFARLGLRLARSHGRNIRFAAIVGHGPEGYALARHIVANPGMGFRIMGIFDSQPMSSNTSSNLPQGVTDGGSLETLAQRLMREPVDEVLIALPMDQRFDDIVRVLSMCERIGVSARVTGELFREGRHSLPRTEMMGSKPCLHFDATPDWGWQGQAKRVIDIVGALLGLIVLSPLLLAVFVLVRLDSPGPAIFAQTRVGRNRQHFKLYKFRTMRQDAEALQAALENENEAGGPVFKIKHDPRITRVGGVLRKYSIDELPQLVNVLKGEMSIVGPRPLPLRDVDRFEQDWHSRRFSVRPGLTCSWVLNGRSKQSFEAWVENDLDYIDNWSLLRDIRICLRTIPVVLKGSGAY